MILIRPISTLNKATAVAVCRWNVATCHSSKAPTNGQHNQNARNESNDALTRTNSTNGTNKNIRKICVCGKMYTFICIWRYDMVMPMAERNSDYMPATHRADNRAKERAKQKIACDCTKCEKRRGTFFLMKSPRNCLWFCGLIISSVSLVRSFSWSHSQSHSVVFRFTIGISVTIANDLCRIFSKIVSMFVCVY